MPEYYISSTKCAIQERQTKRNGKVYDVVFRITSLDGEEKQKKLSGYKSKGAAKAAHAKFITEHCELVKNNPLKKRVKEKEDPRPQLPTVGKLFELHLQGITNQTKQSSIYDRKKVFNSFILPYYENAPITDLTKEELYKWQDNLWATVNPSTREHYSYEYLCKIRMHFAAFLAWVETRHSFHNAFPDVVKPKRRISKRETEIWTREQFEQFIAVVDNPVYHALFTTAFFTGRRKGELFALTQKDVDLKKKQITVNKSLTTRTTTGNTYEITSTKADKSQKIPVCDRVIEELKAYKGTAPFFFSRDGGASPLSDTSMQRAFTAYCEKAGVPKIRFHDLRHSYVSMLIHLGANFTVIADLIGDTVEQVTKTYGHMYISDKLEIVSKIK